MKLQRRSSGKAPIYTQGSTSHLNEKNGKVEQSAVKAAATPSVGLSKISAVKSK